MSSSEADARPGGPAAAVLAGGRGARLGRGPKGLVPVAGETMLARELAVLAPLVSDRLVVVGAQEGALVAAHAAVAAAHGARVVHDFAPGRGPLAGLEAALVATRAPSLLLFGCDLPLLDAALVRHLRDVAPSAQAVVPRVAGRPQPLHARYRRDVLPAVSRRLADGALRLVELLEELDVYWLDYAGRPRGLFNVNSGADLAEAERLLAGR